MDFCDFCLNRDKLIKCVNCSVNKKKELFFCDICYKLHNEFHNKDGDFCLSDIELTGKDLKTYNFLYNQEKVLALNKTGLI